MTIQKALDRVDQLKPNRQARELKVGWLSELDMMIYKEIIKTHGATDGRRRRTLMELIVEVEPEEREAAAEEDAAAEEQTFSGYTPDTDPETVLLAPMPYDDVYMYYLFCQIDLQNQELEKYNNDNALFSAAYTALRNYWNRTHMPNMRNRELRF